MSLDEIRITGLRFSAHIGVPAEERAYIQRVDANLVLKLPLEKAAHSGNVADTICYATVAKQIGELAASREWILVEQLAESICQMLFANYQQLRELSVEIKKLVVPLTDSVGVCLHRVRS